MTKSSGNQFAKMPRELLESDAWREMGINARRIVDFLLIEHMKHGGRRNGFLLAPRRQLECFGVSARHVSGALDEAENLGFIDCRRGRGRRPSIYTLTWLPLSDGRKPSNRWRACLPHLVSPNILVGLPKGSITGIRREVIKAPSDFPSEVINPPNQGYPKGSTILDSLPGFYKPAPATSTGQRAHGGTVPPPRRRPGKPYSNGHDE
jgi:hypothetical protein